MYDDIPTRYNLGLIDYGASSNTVSVVKGPLGKGGWLHDYGCYDVTEAFNGGTTNPIVRVGTAGDDDHYGDDLAYGALAIADGGMSVLTTYPPGSDGFNTIMVLRRLPADTAIYVTHVAATGSGLTGQAKAFLDVVWDK